MRKVILTVGPQGVGKSTYCEQVHQAHPEIFWISRDVILTRLFRSEMTGDEEHIIAKEIMWTLVTRRLKTDGITLTLDTWSQADDWREITERLRRLNGDIVEAWYFVTPFETAINWFFSKYPPHYTNPDPVMRARLEQWDSEDYSVAYYGFHSRPPTIDYGFEIVQEINPLESNNCSI